MTPVAVVLLTIADPQPCEPVPNIPDAMRCPGTKVCRRGQCVPDPLDQRPQAVAIVPPPRSPFNAEWFHQNARMTIEVGPFLGKDTAGVIEGRSGVSASIGLSLRINSWLGVEVPLGFNFGEFSSKTATPPPMSSYHAAISLDQVWLGAVGGLDRVVGRVRLKAAAGPEVMIDDMSASGTTTLPLPSGAVSYAFGADHLTAGLAFQWLAAVETPVGAYWGLGLVYRGHYAPIHYPPMSIVVGDADVGGHTISLRLSVRL